MCGIPLSWLQLTNEKGRLMAALAGIAFAVVLMLMQLGLLASLLNAALLYYSQMRADLIMISPQYEYILATGTFSQHRLYQSLAFDGVQSVAPVYINTINWKNPVTSLETKMLLIGVDPEDDVFTTPGIRQNLKSTRLPDVVLFDTASHVKFGPIAKLSNQKNPVLTEINGRRVQVGGLYRLGIGFATVGTALTSDLNFLRLLPARRQGMIDIGLIRLKPGTDPEKVREQMARRISGDVQILTRGSFFEREKDFWNTISPIGFVFGLGALMGFIVGAVIVYQILYTDVSDHLSEYATLKAIGYRDRNLFSVVLKEALLLAVLGYFPGIAIAETLYMVTARSTNLPIFMTAGRAVAVFIFTMIMCCVSAALAMRRLRSADPAEIF